MELDLIGFLGFLRMSVHPHWAVAQAGAKALVLNFVCVVLEGESILEICRNRCGVEQSRRQLAVLTPLEAAARAVPMSMMMGLTFCGVRPTELKADNLLMGW